MPRYRNYTMPLSNSWKDFVHKWGDRVFSFRNRAILLSGLIATTALSLGKTLQITEPLELLLFDYGVRATKDYGPDPRLLIVSLTDEDIANYGWPLPESILAQLIRNLQVQGARVVGLDLHRYQIESQELIEQLQKDNVVGIFKADVEGNFPAEAEASVIPRSQLGFSDLVVDKDGVVRRSLLFVGSGESATKAFYSFPLIAALKYLNIRSGELIASQDSLYIGDTKIPILNRGDGGYQNVDASGYQILLRYRDRLQPAIRVPVNEVLENTVDPALIEGKLVLVGSNNSSLKDYFYTPYSAQQANHFVMPGVFIHAQIASHLLDIVEQRNVSLYHFIPVWLEPLILFSLTIFSGCMTWNIKRVTFRFIVISFLIALIFLVGHSLLLAMVWIPIAELILGVLLSTTLITGQRLLYQSAYDELTQLPKRELFARQMNKKLRQMKTQADPGTIDTVFIDVERINLINKSLGYQIGEKVIKEIVRKLKNALPYTAKISRLGDTEFAFFILNRENKSSSYVKRVQRKIDEPIVVMEHKFILNSNVGVATSTHSNFLDSNQLIQNAHLAMYQSKLSRRSRQASFSNSMLNDGSHRLSLESRFLDALEKQDFTLFYQPIVCLKTNTISGFEALIRWPQKDGSYVPPDSFIPVAEETGLILPLGEWIIDTAFRQLNYWKETLKIKKLTMSVNLSSHQIDQDGLVRMIQDALFSNHLQGTDVCMEITESMVMNDVSHAVHLMSQLRELGVKLNMDDFGTGYSSLSYLHQLPLDIIKIDKSFIGRIQNNLDDSAIVNAILSISRSLSMDVVAEGVETASQVEVLRQNACAYGQGYFFARPLNTAQATEILQNPALLQFMKSDSLLTDHDLTDWKK